MSARERGFWAGMYLACGVTLYAMAIIEPANVWHPFFGAVLCVFSLYHWNREATP